MKVAIAIVALLLASATTARAAAPLPGSPAEYAQLLLEADDYWVLAERLQPLAENGDPAAQFWLHALLFNCRGIHSGYVSTVGKPKGYLRMTAERRMEIAIEADLMKPELARRAFTQCRRLVLAHAHEDEPVWKFGDARELLRQSADAGYVMARAQFLPEMYFAASDRRTPAGRARIRSLAREVAAAKEPLAWCSVGLIVGALADSSTSNIRHQSQVWTLMALHRGVDCRRSVLWMTDDCTVDFKCKEPALAELRKQVGGDFDDVQRRALALEARIRDGTLRDVDVGD